MESISRDLESAIHNTPVPDIIDNNLATLVQNLVYHPVFTDTDPVKVLGTCKPVGIVGKRVDSKIFNMFKICGRRSRGIFWRSFSALFLKDTEYGSMDASHITRFFNSARLNDPSSRRSATIARS
jgi:hypothetical protein